MDGMLRQNKNNCSGYFVEGVRIGPNRCIH